MAASLSSRRLVEMEKKEKTIRLAEGVSRFAARCPGGFFKSEQISCSLGVSGVVRGWVCICSALLGFSTTCVWKELLKAILNAFPGVALLL